MLSNHSDVVSRAVQARSKPASAHKPSIDISIDRHFTSKVYTSGSIIAGHATVSAQKDTHFDDFDITFAGVAATRVDFVQQYPSRSYRTFMKLRMPIAEAVLPESQVFKAGETYTIPFDFVVPHQLTIGACNHRCTSPAVQEQHLRLLPTVGFWEGDDQAPEMVQVEYSIRAKATRRARPGAPAARVLEGQRPVKVLPALPEDAPLDITFRDERYNLSKSKVIRKSLFSGKTGKMTLAATQPSAIMLSADGRQASQTSARINLEFAPTSVDTAPPKINSVSAKITSTTYFGSSPADHLPNLGSRTSYQSNPILNYTTNNSLFTSSVDKVSWQQQNVTTRRDSGYSSYPDEDASETDGSEGRGRRGSKSKSSKKANCPIKHTSTLDVPLTIPTNNRKFFLPSFHSCLVSRAYTLQLSLSVGPTNTAVSLAVPLQIGVETIYEPQGGELPSFESAMAQAAEEDADMHLQPRFMQVSEGMAQNHSLLPGYESLSRRTVRAA